MRKEDEQAIRRTVALLKIKCQEQKACCSCPFYILTEEGNHVHHGCIFDVPPAYLNAEDIINEGSQTEKHEKINCSKPYRGFNLVSMAVSGGKLFVMLLIIAFLFTSLVEGACKIVSKRELEDRK